MFWTGADWERLGKAIAANRTPCGEYWISIPSLAANKKGLRVLQDDVIRALGVHPIAEFTLGEGTGWANWVLASPDDNQTWFTAGVEFRKAMAAAGYSGPDETWLLNELDRSTMRDAPRDAFPVDQAWPAFPREAMVEVLQGLYYGAIGMEPLPGIVEIGIHHRHQNMPADVVRQYKSEAESWLADNDVLGEDLTGGSLARGRGVPRRPELGRSGQLARRAAPGVGGVLVPPARARSRCAGRRHRRT